ncbi:hypothetical protein D3C76_1170120 [compost metagenome]
MYIVSLSNSNLYFPPRAASAGEMVIDLFKLQPFNMNCSCTFIFTVIIKSPFFPPFFPGIPKAASRILSPSFMPIGTFTENVLRPPL